jgi:hypothetical protein
VLPVAFFLCLVMGAVAFPACSSSDASGRTSGSPPGSDRIPDAVFVEPPVGDAPFRFVDVTVATGFAEPHAVRELELPFTVTGGAAAVDFDDDGDVDVYLTRVGLPNRLMRNNGDGTFTDVATEAGVDAVGADGTPVFADVDGDGDLDLLVTGVGETGRTRLFMNNGDGTFTDEAEERGVTSDLVVRDGRVQSKLLGAAFGDPDRDGDLDLVVLQWYENASIRTAPRSRFFRNDGAGYFTDVTDEVGLAGIKSVAGIVPVFHDVDGDGWQDLLVVADWKTSRAFRNKGDGTFEDVTDTWGVGREKNGMGSVIVDLDGDGREEWFVTSINYPKAIPPPEVTGRKNNEGLFCPDGNTLVRDVEWTEGMHCDGNALYSWNGERFDDVTDVFGVRSGYWGWGAVAADFDLDGTPELAMTNGIDDQPRRKTALNLDDPFEEFVATFRADPNRLWRRDGPGVWKNVAAATGFANTEDGKALLAFDMDGDGDLDVLQANTVAPPILYRTDTEPGRRWLRVKLVEPGGLRGAGAKVEVTPVRAKPDGATEALPTQARSVFVGGTYMGQNPYELTFGLSDATRATVEVVWADGTRQKVGTVDGDRQITVEKKNTRK